MSSPQYINFRLTLAYVTDGANTYFENSAGGNYPTTSAQGNSVGWETAVISYLNRNAGIDPRLAGIAFWNTAVSPYVYKIDLTNMGGPGQYDIVLACGDPGAASNDAYVEVFDNLSSLGVIANTTNVGSNAVDASNNTWSEAAWPGSNVLRRLTFATNTARFAVGNAANPGSFQMIQHLGMSFVGGGASFKAGAAKATSIIGGVF